MNDQKESRGPVGAMASSAIETGRSAMHAAATGARTGAKLAVGTFFAGCNLLLDLGVKAARRVPFDAREAERDDISEGGLNGHLPQIGWWLADEGVPLRAEGELADALRHVSRPLHMVRSGRRPAIGLGGRTLLGTGSLNVAPSYPLCAYAPAVRPEELGDPAFRAAHGLKYAYLAGAMANGIGSEDVVEAMSRAGMLAFFGSAGLSLPRIEQAIDRLQQNLGDAPYGINLIHSPSEPDLEAGTVDLYLRRGVRLVDASAFLDLTLPLVRYRVGGIGALPDGRVVCPNTVFAKVSRGEVARKFMSPPPANLLSSLVQEGFITEAQARMAEAIPMASDVTVEADSGGHTDNRPAIALFGSMVALRDELQAVHRFAEPIRVGLAGGVATPSSVAAALAMGAAYVMTGSINQACVEAGTSSAVKEMLAQAGPADVAMAPAADMFEMGVKVQVLKWGTMFAVRARKLYDLYREYPNLDAIPASQRATLERDYFRCSLEAAWEATRAFFETRDRSQIARAEADAKHKMALVFRSYLGRTSDWANRGDPTRRADYQIWCGPAMGAFNEWTRGTFLAEPANRRVVTVAMNLMFGAAVLARAGALRMQGVRLDAAAAIRPLPMDEIRRLSD